MVSFEKAKEVGFLCQITDEDSYKEIFSLFSQLPKRNRNYWLMGYIDDKIVPFYCIQQLTADYFCNKELNWFGKPRKVQIFDFMSKEFDILVDFTQSSLAPIQTILALSHAKFIVGANQMNDNFYDLHIDTEDSLSPYALLEQIHIYTQKLSGNYDKR